MKKTLSIIIALVMLLGLAIPVSADTVVTFTIESKSCDAGDNIRLAIEIESTAKANSFGLSDFTYNTAVFEFVGFDDDDEEDEIAQAAFPNKDDDNQIASAGWLTETGKKVNGTFVHVTFKVKSTAPTGNYTISATPLVKLNTTELGSAVVPATISVTGSSAVVLEQDTDIEEVKDSYVNATSKAITVDNRTITGSNVFVTSGGQIRVDAGENAKIARDNGDGTTSQGFIFGAANPSGIINVVFEFEGTANDTNYTGKTVTKQFDFTGSEISLANFGYAIVNIPKPLVVTVKAE